MDTKEFRQWAHHFADWMADYYEDIEKFPVKSQVLPGEIGAKLPLFPPAESEDMENIFIDFREIILPGITHWQSPDFFAYFPANGSFPSILGEMLTAALGAQCMIWETSPAAAELEERVMDWLKLMTGLPQSWSGVIQDTASTSTLAAILSAREKYSGFGVNNAGFAGYEGLRVYCSTETHSSIEKAVKIAGIGRQNLVKVQVDDQFRMDVKALRKAITGDLEAGLKPCCVVATLGTTGSTSVDPLSEIAGICREFNLWLHVDAAYGGTALLLPEYRWMTEGIERADSIVFNPHKWMFTNFDCSAYFVKDKESLIRTFEILPEYLKTATRGQVNDYRDWGVPLGRRFRALKLWFVIRSFGVDGLKSRISEHIEMAKWFERQVIASDGFELLAPRIFSVVCFRYHPLGLSAVEVNHFNQQLLQVINKTGKLYLSHTKLNGNFVLRMSIAQTETRQHHVEAAWESIRTIAANLNPKLHNGEKS
ncbi:MAG TPA: aminotransferase class I/II-fold pyridoxal phosphate-dependent enzyme [Bacteroidales bacterium]|nr:aminotransferase class I/II-fold pyridoxal phosphate-dependent enzyme [Bacteroidales bacterium]